MLGWSLAIVAGAQGNNTMTISISTNHFLLDGHGLTITVFGYEISWLGELMIERLDTGHTWHWRRGRGRWTSRLDGEILDGWK
jgi:hypothetical protein